MVKLNIVGVWLPNHYKIGVLPIMMPIMLGESYSPKQANFIMDD
ncbi:hypothetical protein [Okeania sp. SIO3I5]|nr:hypothetical protein [Okeania sp. SIO3I5]